MSEDNLYKVSGWNGTKYVFSSDMSHAIEKYLAAEKTEWDEYRTENPDHLTEDELAEGCVFEQPHTVSHLACASEVIR